jgi:hypothetical protein
MRFVVTRGAIIIAMVYKSVINTNKTYGSNDYYLK